ncbi:MAG: miniconductance mechanosensitive channel [Parvicella sp.]|jgi:miniconductance mechanosensitive channel|tara:strand:+ start:2552 stop:3817 length:1266 start_codon:yes stop_codon:yes gene_type:complete
MNYNSLEHYINWFHSYFVKLGMETSISLLLSTAINCIIFIITVTLLDIITRKIIVRSFRIFSDKTKTTYDDYLVKSNFPRHVAHFIPVVLILYVAPIIFEPYHYISQFLVRATDVYLIVLAVFVFRSLLRTTENYLRTIDKFKDKPLQSYIQVLMIFAWGIATFFIINELTGYSIVSLTTLGATSAALLLIFRDTILGFVASIQISVNDIVRLGDWITFSKFGADGAVIEINLATVRVQNFDNTFTTIPTYSLISDSFQNWRGMQESPGRRIKRSIFIKQSSISFISETEIKALQKIEKVKDYIDHRQKDIDTSNAANNTNKELLVNGRNQTNLGVFRKYIDAYLRDNPAINKDMFLMVRHLAPTSQGIPIEIYCFSNDQKWENYEHIQANIFDHLLAAVPYFNLEIFELPTGHDLTNNNF